MTARCIYTLSENIAPISGTHFPPADARPTVTGMTWLDITGLSALEISILEDHEANGLSADAPLLMARD